MGPVAQPVFKTGAAWQPHARSVRLRRRSVEPNSRVSKEFGRSAARPTVATGTHRRPSGPPETPTDRRGTGAHSGGPRARPRSGMPSPSLSLGMPTPTAARRLAPKSHGQRRPTFWGREDSPPQGSDRDAGRAPLAAGDRSLAHPAVPRPQVLARGLPADRAERRVRAASAGEPRPHRERHVLAAPGAAPGHVAPRQPPGVAGGQLEDPDPGRPARRQSRPEGRRERVLRLVVGAEGEAGRRHPAGADREPPPRPPAGDLGPAQ
jgi:hypothetical protein